ncbi:hypothetical protein CYCD_07570 [Tenuifilaceae bacterium CYCD]|nr:hypothetical protein CYCD_07570 [Tenuifilaceae bacterium CYCD]
MSTENNKDIAKVLSYGVLDVPAELELLVKSKITQTDALPQKSNLGIIAGWVPLTISVLGLIVGIFTSLIMFFPELSSALQLLDKIFRFILSPSVMVVVLSVLVLILLDSIFEKTIRNAILRLG